ncbi:MAG TPA: 1,4-alpha-glucan branching protein GlgB [Acidiphilium sp.]|nr:MAG: 1,4-alpha-glucan branching enzyme [Acidiphilium sp. 21-60-14]OYV91816.1 MAG: 1,4-alpha-glucan branching enzyme [Acidiphilium sp. 37-60-79]OZB41281.1 MAG: 1,4-alpha-glucan branching enzyme [Acidiphilium sp. 34-60-192]HQT88085.1 1,4-alpha-glucan branching protein GlgB [Acidiphilium sp.]HQU22999.1 1,4-alpha-glucan branching protein GlgB [Acidiphilium sp.]
MVPDKAALAALMAGRHGDPFAVLGPHRDGKATVVRTIQPGADAVTLLADNGVETPMVRIQPGGIFQGTIAEGAGYRLVVRWGDTEVMLEDPYRFTPILGDVDLHLIAEGRHWQLADRLGAHRRDHQNVAGVHFAVWAPQAARVSVIGVFNRWDGRRHPMRLHPGAGIWEIFIPGLAAGDLYKYEILTAQGAIFGKADPLAQQTEGPPRTASIVTDPAPLVWTDDEWCANRRSKADRAMSIYEVHASSWRRHPDGSPYLWRELADTLIPYVREAGFTHIELLPVMAHPFGGSWGYQPTGLFAPMPQLGTPAEFGLFVDRCHAAGLGVILDIVPGHFPTDAHGLARFDGSALYEYADPREGFHPDWNTLIYNFARREVSNFLIAHALFWVERFHIDGLRVDAVASMLYRDYSRPAGNWIANAYGGRENLEAVALLRLLNETLRERAPDIAVMAEESTSWPGVTRAIGEGGLGFSHKWNLGWMHDTLDYIAQDPIYRRYHHNKMTFGLTYAFSEHFVLPISHDEVVHGKCSLLGKMPGDEWQKFANLRLYLSYMWTQPGKKLLFMGQEFGQRFEWNHDAQLPWWELEQIPHAGIAALVGDLNRLYRGEPALSDTDFAPEGFRWIIVDDREQSVFAWQRRCEGAATMVLVANFTPEPRAGYRLGVPQGGEWREILNSDATLYGGSGLGNGGAVQAETVPAHGHGFSVVLTVPPLALLVLRGAA